MCDFFAWERGDEERKEAHRAFKDAMVIRFNGLYGTDITKIENWHKLCVAVYIEPLPTTIEKCKEVSAQYTLRWSSHLKVIRRSRESMSILWIWWIILARKWNRSRLWKSWVSTRLKAENSSPRSQRMQAGSWNFCFVKFCRCWKSSPIMMFYPKTCTSFNCWSIPLLCFNLFCCRVPAYHRPRTQDLRARKIATVGGFTLSLSVRSICLITNLSPYIDSSQELRVCYRSSCLQ